MGPLADRDVVVLSRDLTFNPAGVSAMPELDGALDIASALGHARGARDVMVAGGGQIYAVTLPLAARLLVTHVEIDPKGDTRFPAIDPATWYCVERLSPALRDSDTARYSFATYVRR